MPYDAPDSLEHLGTHGQTALMFAVKGRSVSALKLLVDSGADIYAKTSKGGDDDYGDTAFDLALSEVEPEMVMYLWERSDKVRFRKGINEKMGWGFYALCTNWGREKAKLLISYVFDNIAGPQIATDNFFPGVRCADGVHFLLDRGASFTPTPDALLSRSIEGNLELVSLYVQLGVDVNAHARNNASTALIFAASAVHLKVVEFLLAEGADPNAQDSGGRTALIAAMGYGGCFAVHPRCEELLDILKALIRHGAKTDLTDAQHKSALDYLDLHKDEPYRERIRQILLGQT